MRILGMAVTEYFDTHAHNHDYNRSPEFYSKLGDYIKTNFPNGQKIRILDVGCASGSFIKKILEQKINADFVGVDVSRVMIQKAGEQLSGYDVDLRVASGFDITESFDVIHIDSVLHHLIASTRYGSVKMAEKMVKHLISLLSPNGIIIVGEIFYNSYLIPTFTSSVIFHMLKLFNALKIDGSFIHKDIQLGLDVNFFSERKILSMLQGNVKIFERNVTPKAKQYRLLLLKEMGHGTYIMNRR